MLGASIALPPPLPALATNVRLADVDSPKLRAGLEAATSGNFARAEEIFASLLEEDASSASVWSNIGNVHLSQGRPERAYEDFTTAIGLAPQAPVPYLNRAIALEELGLKEQRGGNAAQADARWQQAITDCGSAIARDAAEFAAWFNKGNVELRLLDYDAALASFTTAADLAPGIPGYRLRSAQLQFQCGQRELAVRTVKGVLRKNPQYAEAHATLAAMMWSMGNYAVAEDQLSAADDLGGRWRDPAYIAASTRWPPALSDAMQRLATIRSGMASVAAPAPAPL